MWFLAIFVISPVLWLHHTNGQISLDKKLPGVIGSSFLVNGNEMTDYEDRLVVHYTDPPEEVDIVVKVQISLGPFPHKECEEGHNAICEPIVAILKDDTEPIYQATNYKQNERFPHRVLMDKMGLAMTGGVSFDWHDLDGNLFLNVKFDEANFQTLANIANIKPAGRYGLVLLYKSDDLAKFNNSKLAQIDVVIQNDPLTLPQVTTSDNEIIRSFGSHYIDGDDGELAMPCHLVTLLKGNVTAVKWEKLIIEDGQFYTREKIIAENIGSKYPTADVFAKHAITGPIGEDYFLHFLHGMKRHSRLYRCVVENKWLYYRAVKLIPDGPKSGHFFLQLNQEFFELAPSESFFGDPLGSGAILRIGDEQCFKRLVMGNRSIVFGMKMQLSDSFTFHTGKTPSGTMHLCYPDFIIFADEKRIFSTLAVTQAANKQLLMLPYKTEAIGFKHELALSEEVISTPEMKLTFVAGFKWDAFPSLMNGNLMRFFQQNYPIYTLERAHEQTQRCIITSQKPPKQADRCHILVEDKVHFGHWRTARLVFPELQPIKFTYVCELAGLRDPKFLCTPPNSGKPLACDLTAFVMFSNPKIGENVHFWSFRYEDGVKTADERSIDIWWLEFFEAAISLYTYELNITLRLLNNTQLDSQARRVDFDTWNLMLATEFTIKFSYGPRSNGSAIDFPSPIVPNVIFKFEKSRESSLETNCRRSVKGFEYAGNLSATFCGEPCQPLWPDYLKNNMGSVNWASFPEHFNASLASNYCRNPENRQTLYCPISDHDYRYCYVPPCENIEEQSGLFHYFKKLALLSCDCLVIVIRWDPITSEISAASTVSDRIASYHGVTVGQCAQFCLDDAKCLGFNYYQNYTCTLKACKCDDPYDYRKCNPGVPVVHYEKTNPLPGPPPLMADDPPETESFFVHNFEEGIADVAIPCRRLGDISGQLARQAVWERFDPRNQRFSVMPGYGGTSRWTSGGFFLTFGSVPLTHNMSGIYRCHLNGMLEYHQVTIFKPVICRTLVNSTFYRETWGVHGVSVLIPDGSQPIVIDFACNFSEGSYDIKRLTPLFTHNEKEDRGNSTKRSHFLRENDEFKVFQARYEIGARGNVEFGGNYSIYFAFIPKPVPNTVETFVTISFLDKGTNQFLPSVTSSDPFFKARIAISPWKDTPFNIGPTTMSDRRVTLRIEPGTAMKFTLSYELEESYKEYSSFCSPHNKYFCVNTNFDPNGARFTGRLVNSTVYHQELELPGPFFTWPQWSVDKYRENLAGIYVVSFSAGEKWIEHSQKVEIILEIQVLPTFHAGYPRPYDCYWEELGEDYAGVKAKSACYSLPCVDWTLVPHGKNDPKLPQWIEMNFCRSSEDSPFRSPWCYVNVSSVGLVPDFCDIPHCTDTEFRDNPNYDRFPQICDKCGSSSVIVPSAVTVRLCRIECDMDVGCYGFDFNYADAECALFEACLCSDEELKEPACLTYIGSYYFRKRNLEIWKMEPPELPVENTFSVQIHHVEATSVRFEIPTFSNNSEAFSFIFSPRIQGSSSEVENVEFGTCWHRHIPHYCLKYKAKMRKDLYEGLFLIKQNGSPDQYSFVKVNMPPKYIVTNGRSSTDSSGYKIDFLDRSRVLDKPGQSSEELAYIDIRDRPIFRSAGGHIYNPRIFVYRRPTGALIYDSRHPFYEHQYSLINVQLDFQRDHLIRLEIEEKREKAVSSFGEYSAFIKFYPITQDWPVKPFNLTFDDDDFDREIEPKRWISIFLSTAKAPNASVLQSSFALVLSAFLLIIII